MRLFVRVLRKLEFRIFRSFTVVLLLLLNLKIQGQLKLCLYITHNYQGEWEYGSRGRSRILKGGVL